MGFLSDQWERTKEAWNPKNCGSQMKHLGEGMINPLKAGNLVDVVTGNAPTAEERAQAEAAAKQQAKGVQVGGFGGQRHCAVGGGDLGEFSPQGVGGPGKVRERE